MNPLRLLVDTTGFPPRWHCGSWTSLHGWVHIASDALIFGAYAAIPAVIAYYTLRRRDLPFPRVAWLFVVFIVSCGVTHAIDASLFWHPWYRLSALLKMATALASWLTVYALIDVVPRALLLPGAAALNVALTREIEERRQTAEALSRTNDALRAQARALARSNEALEIFAFSASHELHEPLRKIVGFATLLREEKGDALDDEGRAYIESMHGASVRMQALVRMLLALSRVSAEEIRVAPVDADVALQRARDELDEALQAVGATIEVEPLGAVNGHATQLQQVFFNLLSNAVKYRHQERPLHVRVTARRDAETVTIAVQDNGIGIDADELEEVFQPFRRLRRRSDAPGSGVGLTLCRHIIERWGAR
ncbi:MAG: ATP-binding protein [Polyangiales bacterium]